MADTPERIWIEQDDCPYFYEESELAEVGSPVTEYIRADLCHRPAPAATDTGLETVGEVSTVRESIAAFAGHMLSRQLKPGDLLCRRSQAEELLAAVTSERDYWKSCATKAETIFEGEKRMRRVAEERLGQSETELKKARADNAAQAARIKELEKALETEKTLSRGDWACQREVDQMSIKIEALEAKLAAAEKALKTARPYVEDYDTRRHNTGVDETLTQIDAVLGGKPS